MNLSVVQEAVDCLHTIADFAEGMFVALAIIMVCQMWIAFNAR